MQATVKAAQTSGDNKGNERLYEYQDQEPIRRRDERAADVRRYQVTAEEAREEQCRREVAMAAASAASAAERLSLAAMAVPWQKQHWQWQGQQAPWLPP